MIKRLAAMLGDLLLIGCAAQNRPNYSGPVVKPAWHSYDVRVSQVPLIHNGTIYVAAKPWAEDKTKVHAFDLKSGKQLWASVAPVDRIVCVSGSAVLVVDAEQRGHILDVASGKDAGREYPAVVNGAADRGSLYILASGGTLERVDPPWKARASSPGQVVAAGANVFVAGESSVEAFDASSGKLRWTRSNLRQPQIAAGADAVYVATAEAVSAIDAATGQQLWSLAGTRYPEAPALLGSGQLGIRDMPPGKDGPLGKSGYMFRIVDRSKGAQLSEARTAWKYDRFSVHEGRLYASDRRAHALLNEGGATSPDSWITAVDLRSGKELWRSEIVPLASFTNTAAGEGMVVVGSEAFGNADPKLSGIWAWREQ